MCNILILIILIFFFFFFFWRGGRLLQVFPILSRQGTKPKDFPLGLADGHQFYKSRDKNYIAVTESASFPSLPASNALKEGANPLAMSTRVANSCPFQPGGKPMALFLKGQPKGPHGLTTLTCTLFILTILLCSKSTHKVLRCRDCENRTFYWTLPNPQYKNPLIDLGGPKLRC